ncbi:MAG: hypothetical protein RR296_12590, partial [Clostridia bacterium]
SWRIFRGARRIEWIAVAALAAALCLIALGARGGRGAAAPVNSAPSAQELKVAQVLSMVEGAGTVRVLIGEGDDAGVLIVATGADDLRVRIALSGAVQTLLGVENSRIEVLKMSEGG